MFRGAGLIMNRLRQKGRVHFRQVMNEPQTHLSEAISLGLKNFRKNWPCSTLEMINDGPSLNHS